MRHDRLQPGQARGSSDASLQDRRVTLRPALDRVRAPSCMIGMGHPGNIINFQSISCLRSRNCSAYRDCIGITKCKRLRPRTHRKLGVIALPSIAAKRQS
jgi:hypothetical protein